MPPKPMLCPDWMPSLARSFTRETFRRDEKLKLKGVRRCIRVDDPCAPLDVLGLSCSVRRRRYAVSSSRFGRRKIGRVLRKGWRNRLPNIGGYSRCPEARSLSGHHRAQEKWVVFRSGLPGRPSIRRLHFLADHIEQRPLY